ncbi:MAG: TonB-dependent receptor SusC [Candidatus Ordinivivax streblomastigis]|uniref:TonB-dependent receptor SusC n=1 Tax=Candidatus Ordinivivax streblomastigis TaxID=2540710 RepID=A0A5M8P3W8_9BACT|nr:MAG: TonB-dependent receptor SusC [Candidatus Ordinivivax streblomastigis]
MKNIKHSGILLSLLFVLLCPVQNTFAQQDAIQVEGTITDENNETMIGVNVYVKNDPGFGVVTDVDGKYKLKVKKNVTLVFSYIGYQKQEIDVDGRTLINVKMALSDNNVLNEVVITATGARKKVSVSGAITTVDMKTLRTPTSNLTNALAGNVAGVVAMQLSGEPGSNQSEFWIRGISTFGAGSSALVLVDGFERPFNEINIEDIESFSVLKDASATAIYGSRGANGVIIITTKRGDAGKINISGKAEYGYNTRTRTPDFVDGLTYAKLLNEAKSTRNLEPLYNDMELRIIENNMDPDLYPNVNWKDVLLKDGAETYRASVNLSGGGTTARYFVSGSYVNEGGMYKTDKALKDYNTNSNLERYNYRMNFDIDITSTTLLRTGVSGFLEKQNRAGLSQTFFYDEDHDISYRLVNGDGINIWKSIMGYSPLATPLMYSNGLTPAYGTGDLTNPWVIATQTGYNEFWRSKIENNITLEQNFDFITKGLRFAGRFAYDSDGKNNIQRVLWPEQHNTQRRRDSSGNLVFYRVSTDLIMQQNSNSWGERVYNLEGDLSYNRLFNQTHNVGVFVKYAQRERAETSNVGTSIPRGIPRRDQSLSGRISYDLLSRYFVEFNGGYTGSEVFKTGHQFGFFPAISGAWNISEEPLVKNLTSIFDMLKVRYSYGQVGNNKIKQGDDEIRFPYVGAVGSTDLSGYNYGDLNSPNYSDLATERSLADYPGLRVTTLAADYLTWEVATKHNLGLDFSFWNNKFSGAIDVFKDTRSDIYMQRSHLSDMTGLSYLSNLNGNHNPWANIGKMENRGFDGQFNFNQKAGAVDLTMRGNITYFRNKVLEYDEEANALPYKMTQGYRWEQAKGLIALGLFEDYADIRNSPKQEFGAYMPGDIKYKDINGDGLINGNDEVAIGATRVPSLVYGLGASATWKGLDLNVHFQGSGKSSYFINGPAVYPFSEILAGNALPWGNILTDLVGNYWSESNPDPNAKYPRLSYGGNANNYHTSTYWLRDGAYLRFKTLEIGYTIPKQITNKAHIGNVRLHFIGSNLFVWDTLKLWDPELGSGNGMAYPISKSFTAGLTINL